MRARALIVLMVLAAVLGAMPGAQAIHFYRGNCDGDLNGTDDGRSGNLGANVPAAATVMMLHNTFNDSSTLLPVTVISVGQSVKWTWNSAHCHSVTATDVWDSGFFYPTQAPGTPVLNEDFFVYPVPELEPTLSFTRTFTTPGTYPYFCVHHQVIGMNGVVVVQ